MLVGRIWQVTQENQMACIPLVLSFSITKMFRLSFHYLILGRGNYLQYSVNSMYDCGHVYCLPICSQELARSMRTYTCPRLCIKDMEIDFLSNSWRKCWEVLPSSLINSWIRACPLSQPYGTFDLTCGWPQIALDHFEIIGTYNNNILELRILESLHIAKIKPLFNCMKSVHPSQFLSFLSVPKFHLNIFYFYSWWWQLRSIVETFK